MHAPAAREPHPGMGFREFVTLIAALMATNALAIDAMLPALPDIGADYGVVDDNRRQWVITAYLLGFGAAQIVYGTLSDRFGRRPVLIASMALYILFSFVCALATSFELLLAARVVQGIGAAAARVLTISIVRDCYSGRQMARVMSLAFIVFLAVPILAPSFGQLIMLVAPWRYIFVALGLFAACAIAWAALRLPETLRPEHRTPLSFVQVRRAFRSVLTSRIAVGYTLAVTLILGALFGFLNSSQQIFFDAFQRPELFTTIFAVVAAFMAVASFVNSRIVGRYGTRLVSYAALIGFIACSALNLLTAMLGIQTLWSFAALQSATMFCFGLAVPNFGAMAMEPLGHIAGTASSIQGFVTTIGGTLLGFVIGQRFDGTTVPMLVGFALLSPIALVVIAVAEGGLFRARHVPDPS